MEEIRYEKLKQAIEYLRFVVEELLDRHSAEFNIHFDEKTDILRRLRAVDFDTP